MQIKHSTILITSAGNVMGRSISCHFASLGAYLIITDSDAEALNETHRFCSQLTSNIVSYQLEDQSQESIRHLFHAIDNEFNNGIDVLINNYTAVTLPSLLDSQSQNSPFQLTELATTLFTYGQFAAQNMRYHKKEGVIINLGYHNDLAHLHQADNSTALLAGLTKSWAKELNPFKIRIGGVTPRITNNDTVPNLSTINQELIKNTEYILANEYFSGRIIEATA
ncbi:SDR family oxidoreductase [Aliivibrio fischeri]|uniref:SDR family oxidoreductase n=1 Tax=Aliivibrio fischeri TaxID=668 RepID=UPI0007C4503F|nr:SDR family oxidoreductase [Aliivibrio fischeri]